MLKKFCLLPLIILIFSLSLSAKNKPRNLLFGEVGGNGLFLSVNYERYFNDNLSLRAGFGSFPFFFKNYSFPILFNYSFTIPLEIGIGIVPFSITNYNGTNDSFFGEYVGTTLIITTLGFKRINKGIVVRFSLTPFYNHKDSKVKMYGGLSVGLAF